MTPLPGVNRGPYCNRVPHLLSCTRGVTWDRRAQAWVASMKRRGHSFSDSFGVSEYDEEVAFALALIRRDQMEVYWRSVKDTYLSEFPRESRASTSESSDSHESPEDEYTVETVSAPELGMFYDSTIKSWTVRFMSNGGVKERHFRCTQQSGDDSFGKAFEFNEKVNQPT